MNIADAKLIRKLSGQHEKAAYALTKERDRLFPIGTNVRCKMTGITATVRTGSLYPDQILTDSGHMGFTYVEKLPNEYSEIKEGK